MFASRFKRWLKMGKTGKRLGVFLRADRIDLCIADREQDYVLVSAPCPGLDQWEDTLTSLVQLHKLRDSATQIVLSSQFYGQLQTDKPAVPEAELVGALPFAIKDLLNEPLQEVVVDYYAAPSVPLGNERVNVVYANRRYIRQAVSAAQSAGLALEGISIEELALSNVLTLNAQTELLICQQKSEELSVKVIQEGAVCFSRRLRGFNQLSELDDATLGIELLDSLTLEIQRVMDYVVSQLKLPAVSRIVLALPSPDLMALTARLQPGFMTPVEMLTSNYLMTAYDYQMLPAVGAMLELTE